MPVGGTDQLRIFINAYEVLASRFANPQQDADSLASMLADALAIQAFNTDLFLPRQQNALPNAANSRLLSDALRTAYTHIDNFIGQQNRSLDDYLRNNFTLVLNNLLSRYSLARIEDKAISGSAVIGNGVLPGVPPAIQNTIRSLTGRIFVIKATPGQPPQMPSCSSGMIIPYRGIYDRVLTCCHSMVSPEATNPNLEFYFVRSEHLNPNTGLPYLVHINMALSLPIDPQSLNQIDNQNLINYLRLQSQLPGGNAVRRITMFQPVMGVASYLQYQSPRYTNATDCGYGILNSGFQLPNVNFTPIRIVNDIPPGNYDYYAIGYPDFPYYDTANHANLTRELGIAPFTITKCSNILLRPFLNNNNQIQHDATTAAGMSGGPLLRFNRHNNEIEVFGVISAGNMNASYACGIQ